jgi:hypothetical protein
MSKMASNEPFGHLQHKLWLKERMGVKLAIWLSTTKSRESTLSRCVQVKCNTPLESFQGQLQVCFRSRSNRRSGREVMNAQSPGTILGLHFGSPGKKCHSNASVAERHREYYMGEGGGFPWVQAVVNQVSPCCPWLVPTPRVFWMNINQLVSWFWMQNRVIK